MVKKNKAAVFCLLLLMVATAACRKERAFNVPGYIKWANANDNGLVAGKKIQDLEFQLMYKPVDYILACEIKNGALNAAAIDERRRELQGYQYYTFRIKAVGSNELLSEGNGNEQEYYSRLEYFTSYAQEDMMLVDGTDTLPCLLYHYERNFGLSPVTAITLSFENPHKEQLQDKTFIYNDRILGLGKVSLMLKAEDLTGLPQLITE